MSSGAIIKKPSQPGGLNTTLAELNNDPDPSHVCDDRCRTQIIILRYLHPVQEDDEHPLQPELLPEALEELLDPFPMPKRDMSFSVFFEPHFSQATSGFDPKTSFSNPAPQAVQ